MAITESKSRQRQPVGQLERVRHRNFREKIHVAFCGFLIIAHYHGQQHNKNQSEQNDALICNHRHVQGAGIYASQTNIAKAATTAARDVGIAISFCWCGDEVFYLFLISSYMVCFHILIILCCTVQTHQLAHISKFLTFQCAEKSIHNWAESAHIREDKVVKHIVDDTVFSDSRAAHYLSLRWFGSKSRAAQACKDGCVLVNGHKIYGTKRLNVSDELTIHMPPTLSKKWDQKSVMRLLNYTNSLLSVHQNPPAAVLHDDNEFAVMFKPSGVHSLRWMGTMKKNFYAFDDVLPLLLEPPTGVNDSIGRPIPCHRLDARVSGCILVAKTRRAQIDIGKQFETRSLVKEYRAIVAGVPTIPGLDLDLSSLYHPNRGTEEGHISECDQVTVGCDDNKEDELDISQGGDDHPSFIADVTVSLNSSRGAIKRDLLAQRGMFRVAFDVDGRHAASLVRVLSITPCQVYGNISTLALYPLTGRRHQRE